MKKTAAVLFCAALLLFSVCTVSAAQSFYYSMELPAAVTLKKSMQAEVELSSPENARLGAAIYSVLYDPNVLEYKETVLSSGIPGEIKASANGGIVKIVYLNANGTPLPTAEKMALVSLRFTALTTECKTTLTLYTEQAVNIQEQNMAVQEPIEYQITVQAKETTDTTPASGRRVSSSTVSALKDKTTASASKSSALSSGASGNQVQGDDPRLLQNGTYDGADTIAIGGERANIFDNSGFVWFLCGAAAAVVIVVILAAAYIAGLNKRKKQQENGDDRDTEKKNVQDIPIPQTEQKPKEKKEEE